MKKAPVFDGTPNCLDADPAAALAFEGDTGSAGGSVDAARQLCRSCRFMLACRAYALTEDVHGVWGGQDDQERRDDRRRQGLPEPVSIGDELDVLVLGWRHGAGRARVAAVRPEVDAA